MRTYWNALGAAGPARGDDGDGTRVKQTGGRLRRVVSIVFGVFIASICGCAEIPRRVAMNEPSPVMVSPSDPEFAPGMKILQGFDHPRENAPWSDGQSALIGVKIAKGPEHDVWFVLLESQPLPPGEPKRVGRRFRYHHQNDDKGFVYTATSVVAPVRVTVYDGEGKLVKTSTVDVPWMFLANGPWVVSQRLQGLEEVDDRLRVERVAYADGVLSLMGLVQAIRTAPAMRPVVNALWNTVIDTPDLLSLLFKGGVTLDLDADFEDAIPLDPPGEWPVSTPLWMPFPVAANDKPTLSAEIVIGPPSPPYLLTAGILRLAGRHPRLPDRLLTIELLAARMTDQRVSVLPTVRMGGQEGRP